MAVNAPEVQVLIDDGAKSVIKIIGYYNAATSSNTLVVQANTLAFGNTSKTCIVTLTGVTYSTSMANGYVQLQWIGSSSNTGILNFGRNSSGTLSAWIPNNASSPTGDIALQVVNAQPNDSYDLLLLLNKEAQLGYANAYVGYNDSTFKP